MPQIASPLWLEHRSGAALPSAAPHAKKEGLARDFAPAEAANAPVGLCLLRRWSRRPYSTAASSSCLEGFAAV